MSFEKALYDFKNALLKDFGPDADITKIGLSTPLFEAVAQERYTHQNHISWWTTRVGLRYMGELHLYGVQILRSDKDNF